MPNEAVLGVGTCEVTLVGTYALTECGLVGEWWQVQWTWHYTGPLTPTSAALAMLLNLS